MRKVPKTRKNGKIWNFRDETWNSAIYINFREKSRNRGKPVSLNMATAKKPVFDENYVKTKKDAKSFVWSYFGHLVCRADGSVNDNTNVYCSQCFENKELKTVQRRSQY
jgi:hypothetical protein